MASPLKDKIQVFFFGLMLGLLISACFFIFKLDGYFKELNLLKSFSKKNEVVEQIVVNTEGENKAEKKNFTKSSKVLEKPHQTGTSDTLNSTPVRVSASHANDSTALRADSIKFISDENIVVKKDEMIASKMIEVQTAPGAKDIASGGTDSLLNKISGIKKDAPGSAYKVEYWMSPLNYRGYKLLKNKIILYGINPAENIRLYKLDGAIYCRNSSLVYRFDQSSEFRYFDIVTDESLIAKIK
jgi:hypothetical protein